MVGLLDLVIITENSSIYYSISHAMFLNTTLRFFIRIACRCSTPLIHTIPYITFPAKETFKIWQLSFIILKSPPSFCFQRKSSRNLTCLIKPIEGIKRYRQVSFQYMKVIEYKLYWMHSISPLFLYCRTMLRQAPSPTGSLTSWRPIESKVSKIS